MNRRAAKQIAHDIRDEFARIKADLERHLSPDVTVNHSQQLLAEHAPTMVVARSQLLLDTLVGYLMEDAVEALASAPTDVKNDFYALELRKRIEAKFVPEPRPLQLSFDPRIVAVVGPAAAGGTLIAGGLVVGVLLSGVAARILAGLATLVASAFAFNVAHSASTESARQHLETDVTTYLEQSEEHVSSWLAGVEKAFTEHFEIFCSERGVRRGSAA